MYVTELAIAGHGSMPTSMDVPVKPYSEFAHSFRAELLSVEHIVFDVILCLFHAFLCGCSVGEQRVQVFAAAVLFGFC